MATLLPFQWLQTTTTTKTTNKRKCNTFFKQQLKKHKFKQIYHQNKYIKNKKIIILTIKANNGRSAMGGGACSLPEREGTDQKGRGGEEDGKGREMGTGTGSVCGVASHRSTSSLTPAWLPRGGHTDNITMTEYTHIQLERH